ncbi:leucine-rich repeat and fibronectin type-III domain-containing protein 4-like [Argiope bruennichi]|uniref:leucine-rich repeat and fibronectin type-III domain-containing protein 4-like n=1 Tax=Argiope bruennichi TaxID=94029 RepID=UPI0024954764|nr:leucine-rich repeat and fibronectin type-III domain-containing protein 4-like [Argiope bruennichi]
MTTLEPSPTKLTEGLMKCLRLQISCNQLQTESQLEHILKQLKGYSVSKLTITGLNASTWKKDIFDGLHVEVLDLEKIEVNDASFLPGRRHFQGLENSLQTLEIKKSFRNGHRSLINLKLDHLSRLSTIILEDNHIPEVGNDWFTTGPVGLTTLIFERNGIEELGDRAFASLSQLKLLAIAGNHLREISRSVIPRPATQLHTLDLAYNKLRTLPNDLFADMPSLRDVNLDYNLIHILQEDTFSAVLSRLTALSLEGNPLECDEKLQWVCSSRANVISGKCILSATSNGRSVRQFCGV